jgi:hypothetical protein
MVKPNPNKQSVELNRTSLYWGINLTRYEKRNNRAPAPRPYDGEPRWTAESTSRAPNNNSNIG